MKAYGSGNYGRWIKDEYGMPAFQYECDQYTIEEKMPMVNANALWSDYRNHISQIGNDRIVLLLSNFGYVRLRQDEGSPKLLNDWNPENHQYAGGFGYLKTQHDTLTTFYQEQENFERIFGYGYFKKKVWNDEFVVTQEIMPPYGDDPVIISEVTIENKTKNKQTVKWVEYWGSEVYQYSYRPLFGTSSSTKEYCKSAVHIFRREFQKNYSKKIQQKNNVAFLQHNFEGYHYPKAGKYNPSIEEYNKVVSPTYEDASFEDLNIPQYFIVSYQDNTNMYFDSESFFENGNLLKPSGLDNDYHGNKHDAFFCENEVVLLPGEKKTLRYMVGYLPKDTNIDILINKYKDINVKKTTIEKLKDISINLKINNDQYDWLNREMQWHNMYLNASITYDDYFNDHVLSQGGIYQYLMGSNFCQRDTAMHMLPLIYSRPEIAREIAEFLLKGIKSDGSSIDGIAGHGMERIDDYRMNMRLSPALLNHFGEEIAEKFHYVNGISTVEARASDQELFVLMSVCEYVLTTKDYDFLNLEIKDFMSSSKEIRKVIDILIAMFDYIKNDIGVGKNGLLRGLWMDWNRFLFHKKNRKIEHDDIIYALEHGESLFTTPMAVYVFSRFETLLNGIDYTEKAKEVSMFKGQLKEAILKSWNGKWIPRAWVSDHYGYLGDYDEFMLEGQLFTLVSKTFSKEQANTVIDFIKKYTMDPSPIGTLKQVLAPGIKGNVHDNWIWWAMNGILIWGMTNYRNEVAFEEFIKNSLANHADVYPDIWGGTLSGADNYTSIYSEYPGYTRWTDDEIIKQKEAYMRGEKIEDEGFSSLDFPVCVAHVHAWPLFDTIMFLLPESTNEGIKLKPSLPFDEYEITSPLLGYKQRKNEIVGWYHPMNSNNYTITIEVDFKVDEVCVNGKEVDFTSNDHFITFKVENMSKINWVIKGNLL